MKEIDFNSENDPTLEILSFIIEKDALHQKDLYEKVKKDVQEKYGENGLKIFNEINDSINDDCPECNAMENTKILDEIIEDDEITIPNFILDKICEDVIKDHDLVNCTIYCNDILESVKKNYPEYLDFINSLEIEDICNLITSKVLNFNLDDMPKEIQERSLVGGELSEKELETK